MVEKDIVIIGGGPGGYVAAIRAAQLGGKVTLIEREELGGTCLNWGCIPTKALLRGAEILDLIEGGKEYGISAGAVSVDFGKLMARKDRAVKTLVGGVTGLMKANGIEVVRGTGRLLSPQKVEAVNPKQEKEIFQARKVIIASGSVSAEIPIPGAKLPGVIDSYGALALKQVPESLVVIGAGPIGLEFGTVYAALGAKVTVLELLPQVLPGEDPEIAGVLEKALRRFKIQALTGVKVRKIAEGPEERLQVTAEAGGEEKVFSAQNVLMAVGRKPNTGGLGLAEAGVRFGQKGIEVNDRMETNVPGVYAIGDATGKWLLAHYASAQGEVAAQNTLGREERLDDRVVPRCVYTLPEVSSVGLTEEKAREAGYEVRVGRFPFSANAKAAILGERNGLVKIVADGKYGEILGVHIAGPHATDLIGEAVVAMRLEGTAGDIARAIHPHPTLTEAVMEAAFDVEGAAVHIPPRRKP
jgi:dihydrolipoamide dehydrogenase